jgi:hypothetical protein
MKAFALAADFWTFQLSARGGWNPARFVRVNGPLGSISSGELLWGKHLSLGCEQEEEEEEEEEKKK